MGYFSRVKGLVLKPSREFSSIAKLRPRKGLRYLLVMLVLAAFLEAAALTVLSGPGAGLLTFIKSYITGLLVNLLLVVWLHFWAFLFGVRGIEKTSQVVFYGSTPSYLLGWLSAIPVAGTYFRVLVVLWSFCLYWVGLKQLHSIPGWKAGAVVLLSLIVGLAIIVWLALFTIETFIPLLFSVSV